MKKLFRTMIFFWLVLLLAGGSRNAFANNDIKVLGSLTHEKISDSGEAYSGTILIKNAGESPCRVKIYQTDYLFYADGTNLYGSPASNPYSNAKWIALSAKWLTIPAGETAPVNYEVQIPHISDLQGTYWSLVMVEPAADNGPAQTAAEKGKYVLGLQTNIRYGVQIITDIKDSGTRKIELLNKRLIEENGKRFLQLDIKNTGERWLNPSVSVQLYGKDGKLFGTFGNAKNRIFPTCSVRHKIYLGDIPKGEYKALVIVDNGDQYVFGANYELTIQ
jgi:hypothetical protein